jgi:plastocyanin
MGVTSIHHSIAFMKIAFRSAVPACLCLCVCLLSADAFATSVAVQVNDAAGKPLADVVLYAEPEAGVALPKLLKPLQIEQRGLKFLPLVSVIQVGSQISFPNNDRVRHHIYSFSPAKKFDQKLYSGVAAAPQVFDKAGTVVLGCNIHDRMIAYVKVLDTPFFAKSDADGTARIELPAAGKYTVKAWHFNMASNANAEQEVAVKPGDAATAASFRLAMKAPVADGDSHAAAPGH